MSLRGVSWVGFLILMIPWEFDPSASRVAVAKVVYVDKNATGDGSGLDWPNACTTIAAGLARSASGDAVWVKSAMYEESISMREGVSLYGGFPRHGSPEFEQRDWVANETVISSWTAADISASAILDGFAVRGLMVSTNSSATVANCGVLGIRFSGYFRGNLILCTGGSPLFVGCLVQDNHPGQGSVIRCIGSKVTFRDCVVENNSGSRTIAMEGSTGIFQDCTISHNVAHGYGGGFHLMDSAVTVLRCYVLDNEAWWGGGFAVLGAGPILEECLIIGNRAGSGAGIGAGQASFEIRRCVLANNTARDAGSAISGSVLSATVVNSSFIGNCDGNGEGCICLGDYPGRLSVTNSIFWNVGNEIGGATDAIRVRHCCLQGGWPGEGNIDAYPLFADADNGDWELMDGSPCIDAGTDCGLDYLGRAPDIGAWEAPEGYVPGEGGHTPRVLRVSQGAGPDGDGGSWGGALPTIEAALRVASTSDELWVAGGRYPEPVRMETAVAIYGGFGGNEGTREERDWVIHETVIDATGSGGPAVVASDHALLDGFAVTGGSGSRGCGVYAVRSPAVLRNCNITGNKAWRGAGVCVTDVEQPFVVENCLLSGNSGNDGGGFYVAGCSSVVAMNCVVAGNYVADKGGAALVGTDSQFAALNCTFVGNSSALDLGAVFCNWGGSARVVNAILQNPGMELGGTGGIEVLYSCVEHGWPGAGNFSDNPLFVSGETGDYRLQNGSRCIDAGLLDEAPAADFARNPRPGGDGMVDIGAYESPDEYAPAAPKVIHVRADASAGGDGTSWETAFTSIQAALDVALASDEVWVASGSYRESIRVSAHAGLYGGFAGTETSRTSRDWEVNRAIIDATGLGRNCVFGFIAGATIDGFTITGGLAGRGAGLFWEVYPFALRNCAIVVNSATEDGGGVYLANIEGGTVEIQNCVIGGNRAGRYGGGLGASGAAVVELTDCRVLGNRAASKGGGLWQSAGALHLVSCGISQNASGGSGGAISSWGASLDLHDCRIDGNTSALVGGAVALSGNSSFTNCYLVRNFAGTLGGAAHFSWSGDSVFANCTLADNAAGMAAGGIYSRLDYYYSLSVELRNTILWNAGTELRSDGESDPYSVEHTCVQGGWSGQGNISDWPFLAERSLGDFRLQNGSPCIDAGTDAGFPFNGLAPDMGAWESPSDYRPGGLTHITPVLHVAADAAQGGDGTSWERAFSTITRALTASGPYSEIWVKRGIYHEVIQIGSDLSVYGGFAGDEVDRNARDPSVNRTVIDAAGREQSAVVTGDVTILDGFVVTNGRSEKGGGVRCLDYASVRIASCTVSGNTATSEGGGIYAAHGRISVINCAVTDNSADGNGGGVGIPYAESAELKYCDIAGNTAGSNGGGIAMNGRDLLVTDSRILANTAAGKGGGASISGASIEACLVEQNFARGGGGLSLGGPTSVRRSLVRRNESLEDAAGIAVGGDALITGTAIIDNRAGRNGGGIYCNPISPLTVRNSLVVGNSARAGGGGLYGYELVEIFWVCPTFACYPVYMGEYPLEYSLQNCTIAGNLAQGDGSGISMHSFTRDWGGVSMYDVTQWAPNTPSSPRVSCCILRNTGPEFNAWAPNVAHSSVDGGWPGEGNIADDPQFVYPWDGQWGDFRLRASSPCVDAGNPDPAYDDACRPPGLGTQLNDMGAYGGPYNCDGPPGVPIPESDWTPQPTPTFTFTPTPTAMPTVTLTPTITWTPAPSPTPTPHPGDLTGDGLADADDIFFFARFWHHTVNETNFRCDRKADSLIDADDLCALIRLWTAAP